MVKYVDQFEHISDPIDSMKGWQGFEAFEYRVSWRLYSRDNEPPKYRDFRFCAELDIELLFPQMVEWFGPKAPGGRWNYNPEYVYLFLRTKADFTEFRLRIDLPK